METKYAIIDIGSHTIRMIVYVHKEDGDLVQLEDFKMIARLRHYLSDDDMLTCEGIHKLLHALKKCQKITRTYQLDKVVCIATAALRNARNQQSILDVVKQKTGFDIRILSSYEEAYYGFTAVVNSLPISEGLTIDVGGGSTEITYFADKRLIHYHSFSFGALSLKEDFIKDDHLKKTEYQAMRTFIHKQLSSLDWLKKRHISLVGMGGNAHNVVRIHHKKNDKPSKEMHGSKITIEDIAGVFKSLQPLNFQESKKVEGLSKKRADIILPALCVYQCLLEEAGSSHFILSRRGIREGLLEQLVKENIEQSESEKGPL